MCTVPHCNYGSIVNLARADPHHYEFKTFIHFNRNIVELARNKTPVDCVFFGFVSQGGSHLISTIPKTYAGSTESMQIHCLDINPLVSEFKRQVAFIGELYHATFGEKEPTPSLYLQNGCIRFESSRVDTKDECDGVLISFNESY